VFGRTAEDGFVPSTVRMLELAAWETVGRPLEPIGPHACRHGFASMLIASGANAKAPVTVMGHASIATALDRYRHLLAGGEDEVGRLLEAWRAAPAPTG
jgi:integrase